MDNPHCPRCGGKLTIKTMSFFNREMICFRCARDERQAPGYEEAHSAEEKAVKTGNFHFEGVGLSQQDRTFLINLLQKRGPLFLFTSLRIQHQSE